MKYWLLQSNPGYEAGHIYGIFSSPELAKAEIARRFGDREWRESDDGSWFDRSDLEIVAWELDVPIDQETYVGAEPAPSQEDGLIPSMWAAELNDHIRADLKLSGLVARRAWWHVSGTRGAGDVIHIPILEDRG